MRIRSQTLTKLAGFAAALVFRALSQTLRFRGYIEAPQTDPSVFTARSFIYTLWHDEILIPLARQALARPQVAALVSRHQDGAYLAEFMRHLGIHAVRGSTARGGEQAMRELLHQDDAYHIFVTPDGPRGPEHLAKEGLVFLASRTGRPIIPIVSHFENAWHIPGKWTGLWVPKPFGRCWYLLGTPLSIPPRLSRDEILRHRHRVQAETERLAAKLARIVRGEEPTELYQRAA
ncbi:MAG: lysophospholipid acyltransferase family protein [Planctomycetaceae bacterium]